jgi:hypothetical protein
MIERVDEIRREQEEDGIWNTYINY